MSDNENIRRFRDRTEAGRLLTSQLVRYVSRPNLLILALPGVVCLLRSKSREFCTRL